MGELIWHVESWILDRWQLHKVASEENVQSGEGVVVFNCFGHLDTGMKAGE